MGPRVKCSRIPTTRIADAMTNASTKLQGSLHIVFVYLQAVFLRKSELISEPESLIPHTSSVDKQKEWPHIRSTRPPLWLVLDALFLLGLLYLLWYYNIEEFLLIGLKLFRIKPDITLSLLFSGNVRHGHIAGKAKLGKHFGDGKSCL